MSLVPAYGRDYKSAKAVKEDWNAGKDFIVADFFSPYDGKPANKDSFSKSESIQIRYNKLMKVTVVKGAN